MAVGRVTHILRALTDKGLVKIDDVRTSCNKLRYIHSVTPAGIAMCCTLTASVLRRKMC